MKEGSVQSGGVSGMMKGEGYRMKEVGVYSRFIDFRAAFSFRNRRRGISAELHRARCPEGTR